MCVYIYIYILTSTASERGITRRRHVCCWEMMVALVVAVGGRKSLQAGSVGNRERSTRHGRVQPDQGWSNHVILSDHQ